MYRNLLLLSFLSLLTGQANASAQAPAGMQKLYAARAQPFANSTCAQITLADYHAADQKAYNQAIQTMLDFQKQNNMKVIRQKMTKTTMERLLEVPSLKKRAYTYHELKDGTMYAFSCILK